MKRPRRGRTFEEALEHWSPPGEYDRMRHSFDPDQFRLKGGLDPSVARFMGNPRQRELLEDALFARLRNGDLLSSAVGDQDGLPAARQVVSPEAYAGPWLGHDPSSNKVAGPDFVLREVEVFPPHRVPANVADTSSRLLAPDRRESGRGPGNAAENCDSGIPGFHHDKGYRHVTIHEREFSLTPTQAEIVRVLHEAALSGEPWVHLESIRETVNFDTPKLSSLFSRQPDWKSLIESDGRGFYRLRQDD